MVCNQACMCLIYCKENQDASAGASQTQDAVKTRAGREQNTSETHAFVTL